MTDKEISRLFLSNATAEDIIKWCEKNGVGIKDTYGKANKLGVLSIRWKRRDRITALNKRKNK